ncbi:MAG: glutathionylspermidine synthase family protein [Coriobacteriaceae bacterium]|nr:glutathionylspermidine synthase family protein [Coriobacteriaceae bacterium]
MKELREEYISIIEELDGDLPGRRAAVDSIEESGIMAYGAPLTFSYVPDLFDSDDLAYLEQVSTTAHRILCKVIRHFLDDPDYREIFHFPPEVERLILLPCNYPQLLPIARFDLFLNEEDGSFQFCEFNADGTSAMSRDLAAAQALEQGATFREFARRHTVEHFELFDSWVEAFMDIYRSDKNAVDDPNVCITDFSESGVNSDFELFIAAFERRGIPARFVDVRALEFDGELLRDTKDGYIIDAVYRRSVTSEIMQHPGECEALIDAVAAEKVCLIGHFRTTVIHTKMIGAALYDPKTAAFLSDEEQDFVRGHVARTYLLRHDTEGLDLEQVRHNKDAWIIKPQDDYGAHGVYPGVDCATQEDWERLVDEKTDAGYIAQEFCPPYTVDIVLPEQDGDDTCKVEAWESMPGCYLYDGKFVGLYCREGQHGIIALDHGGVCAPSFKVDCG